MEDVAGPQRRLISTDALPHLDDDVLAVERVGLDERELQVLLKPFDLGLQIGRHRRQLRVGLGRGEVVDRLPPVLRQLVRGLELLQAPPDVRRLAVVVVDGGVAHALLRLAVAALELADELIDPGHDLTG